MNEELKPCPFCGSKNIARSEGRDGSNRPWHYIECEDCSALSDPDVWNRRTPDFKQGLLRAAEICDYHDNADDQGYGAWKAAAAIRAEAEKEGK